MASPADSAAEVNHAASAPPGAKVANQARSSGSLPLQVQESGRRLETVLGENGLDVIAALFLDGDQLIRFTPFTFHLVIVRPFALRLLTGTGARSKSSSRTRAPPRPSRETCSFCGIAFSVGLTSR